MERDFFGLEKERKINKSNVRNVFTPHKPIQSNELFFGREQEVTRIIEQLNTPGQHALLYGDRGVGKSSLATVASQLLLRHIILGKLYIKRCDSWDNFASIVKAPLLDVGVDINIIEKSTTSKKAIGGIFNGSLGSDKNTKSEGYSKTSLSPSWVADKFAGLDGLLLIDEFDVLKDQEDKVRISELIKHISDNGSNFKILVVGIAETAQELTAGHPSVQRCLKETRVFRMNNEELKQIIIGGQERLGLEFTPQAINRIVAVSSGYPHFTHLLALKAAEDAIVEDRKNINLKDIVAATHRAVEDSEGSLRDSYNKAARSTSTEEYKKILLAASLCHEEEFKASELRKKYLEIFDEYMSQGKLNNYFKRLVSEDNSAILKRIAKGVFKFVDPRMPSFIKIAQSFIED